MGKWDKLVGRLGRVQAAIESARGKHVMLSDHLLNHTGAAPADWAKIDQFLEDNQMSIGSLLGGGEERLVFDAVPLGDAAPKVLKIGGSQPLYDLPDIPGVTKYTATGVEAGVPFGLQPKAVAVYQEGRSPWEQWERRARDVHQSLQARGWDWPDSEVGNIGLMPDGRWSVIDGEVNQLGRGFKPLERAPTPEDAIRLLIHIGAAPR